MIRLSRTQHSHYTDASRFGISICSSQDPFLIDLLGVGLLKRFLSQTFLQQPRCQWSKVYKKEPLQDVTDGCLLNFFFTLLSWWVKYTQICLTLAYSSVLMLPDMATILSTYYIHTLLQTTKHTLWFELSPKLQKKQTKAHFYIRNTKVSDIYFQHCNYIIT